MNIRSLSGVLAPSRSDVCSYCSLNYVTTTIRRIRRYQHTTSQPRENVASSVFVGNACINLGQNVNSNPQRAGKDVPPTLERSRARIDADDRVD